MTALLWRSACTAATAHTHAIGRPNTDALKRYQYDSDLAVFLQILEGKLPEALQHEEVLLLRRVLAACVTLDKKQGHGGHCTGAVARKDFVEILRHQVRTYEHSLGALVCGGGVSVQPARSPVDIIHMCSCLNGQSAPWIG